MHITDQPIDVTALIAETADDTCGALVVFEGLVRDHHDGKAVARMRYTAYKPLAERVLRELEAEVRERFGVPVCRIVHRVGDLEIGESSVAIVVRSPHRAEAFRASEYAIDTLKHRVPIWKNDFYPDGTSAYQDGIPLSACQHHHGD